MATMNFVARKPTFALSPHKLIQIEPTTFTGHYYPAHHHHLFGELTLYSRERNRYVACNFPVQSLHILTGVFITFEAGGPLLVREEAPTSSTTTSNGVLT
jgi:hypothetical protein